MVISSWRRFRGAHGAREKRYVTAIAHGNRGAAPPPAVVLTWTQSRSAARGGGVRRRRALPNLAERVRYFRNLATRFVTHPHPYPQIELFCRAARVRHGARELGRFTRSAMSREGAALMRRKLLMVDGPGPRGCVCRVALGYEPMARRLRCENRPWLRALDPPANNSPAISFSNGHPACRLELL
jgi:hypothetical protein